ncbi:MAG: acetyl-CoA carboxylase biotin carboxyl carrier protein [Clostridia bacterium]|nr:acetyl-CoA carboxylase biotin carboxyl carrier protein [Clostridia bacterium]
MEYEKIKQLMEDMGNSKLTAIDIDFADGTKISMKKEQKQEIIHMNSNLVPVNNEQSVVTIENAEKPEEIKGNIVKSPMVGTFYLKPSPTSNPYVEIGKEVKKGDTLCIVEAMKLMNEIESEFSGKIIEILVNDGEPVEYGTPLFRIG